MKKKEMLKKKKKKNNNAATMETRLVGDFVVVNDVLQKQIYPYHTIQQL
jgi:hypothetical protein